MSERNKLFWRFFLAAPCSSTRRGTSFRVLFVYVVEAIQQTIVPCEQPCPSRMGMIDSSSFIKTRKLGSARNDLNQDSIREQEFLTLECSGGVRSSSRRHFEGDFAIGVDDVEAFAAFHRESDGKTLQLV